MKSKDEIEQEITVKMTDAFQRAGIGCSTGKDGRRRE